MTTICVARKGGSVAMASDSLVTFGDTRLSHSQEANEKILEIDAAGGRCLVGTAGTVAHFPVLRKALQSLDKKDRKLHSKDEIYDTFLGLHSVLKERFFLQTKEEDVDPYESMQFTVLIANSAGIFGIYSYREIFEFKAYWGIGSGRNFALGAMHASYSRAKTAAEVARIGVEAGIEYDKSSGHPVRVKTLRLGTAA